MVFAEVGPGPTLELPGCEDIRIDGETLRAARDGPVLARHNRNSWTVAKREFFRLDCESPVWLHFESEYGDSSPRYGSFTHFSCADGIAYGDGQIIGNIDLETKRWYDHRTRRHWLTLVVRSARAP